jgi:hypothetical protein
VLRLRAGRLGVESPHIHRAGGLNPSGFTCDTRLACNGRSPRMKRRVSPWDAWELELPLARVDACALGLGCGLGLGLASAQQVERRRQGSALALPAPPPHTHTTSTDRGSGWGGESMLALTRQRSPPTMATPPYYGVSATPPYYGNASLVWCVGEGGGGAALTSRLLPHIDKGSYGQCQPEPST